VLLLLDYCSCFCLLRKTTFKQKIAFIRIQKTLQSLAGEEKQPKNQHQHLVICH